MVAQQLQSIGLVLPVLMFKSGDVRQSDTGPSDLKFKNLSYEKKNRSGDQSQFHMAVVCFSPQLFLP